MAASTMNEVTALGGLAARLAPLVTGSEIADVASHFGLVPEGSSKQARLRDLLATLWQNGRRRTDAIPTVVATLTAAAHSRFLAGENEMTEDDVDAIVREMRRLRLDPGELSHKKWRTGLRDRSSQAARTHVTEQVTTEASRQRSPLVHQVALDRLNQLALDRSIDPRRRGYELQRLVLDVLHKERLSPLYDVRNPGEQIDMAFVVANDHYLLECCWERDPMGLPMVRELRDKVATKAEGTFGVLLSLSGFTSDINTTVGRGMRLNCVGLVHTQLVTVLEGRTTWADLVLRARSLYLGSVYVNDFNRFGRTYQVIAQADAPFRADAESIGRLQVRNAAGAMVPLGSVLTVKASRGPDQLLRYNAYPAADVSGGPAPGVSSGQAVAVMERLAGETLPNGIRYEWTELTYQQRLAGNTTALVFVLCLLLVFLVLAAQYESWSLPVAVILIVPLCLLGAFTGIWLTGGDNNIFTQIGFLVLIGLACKNAILIVEFARELEQRGRSVVQAVFEASRIRLRPILMTSFAFIMGVVPLVLSHGAGAEIRRAMGVAVFSGMLGVTFFGLVLTPAFYVMVRGLAMRRPHSAEPAMTDPGNGHPRASDTQIRPVATSAA